MNTYCDHLPVEHCPQCCRNCWLDQCGYDPNSYGPGETDEYRAIRLVVWETDRPQTIILGRSHRVYDGSEDEILETNAHGVHGTTIYRTFTPKVCIDCPFRDSDYSEWSEQGWTFCTRMIWFPTRKGTCKLREREEPKYREKQRRRRVSA